MILINILSRCCFFLGIDISVERFYRHRYLKLAFDKNTFCEAKRIYICEANTCEASIYVVFVVS
nr:MAG TPA: hypothetical protein [Cressdnaviricota sp.]